MDIASFAGPPAAVRVKSKGLKGNAISFFSNAVIGIASTAPGYSLASALGAIAGFAAFGTPAVMLVAFVPMLFIAVASTLRHSRQTGKHPGRFVDSDRNK